MDKIVTDLMLYRVRQNTIENHMRWLQSDKIIFKWHVLGRHDPYTIFHLYKTKPLRDERNIQNRSKVFVMIRGKNATRIKTIDIKSDGAKVCWSSFCRDPYFSKYHKLIVIRIKCWNRWWTLTSDILDFVSNEGLSMNVIIILTFCKMRADDDKYYHLDEMSNCNHRRYDISNDLKHNHRYHSDDHHEEGLSYKYEILFCHSFRMKFNVSK